MSRGRVMPPSPPVEAVGRDRLNTVLRARFTVPVMTVIAPAGFGKTTALAHAVATDPAGTDLWYSCSDADHDGVTLLGGLAAAVGARQASVEAVIDALWHRAPVQAVLIVDDVHRVAVGGGDGTDVVAELIQRLPANGHLVLSGRFEPPLRLARLRAAGAVVDVAADELRFDDDELLLLSDAHSVAYEELSALAGWPALTMLRARAARGGPATFLYEEVLGELDEQTRSALGALTHLGALDPLTLEAAIGGPLTIARLISVPMITRRADGSLEAHSLWRDAITVDDSTKRAQRQGAIRHRLHAGRPDLAATLMPFATVTEADWIVAREMITAGCTVVSALAPIETLEQWARELPSAFAAEPEGLLLRATVLRRRGVDLAAAHHALADAAQAARDAGRSSTEVAAISQLAHVAWWRADLGQLGALLERVHDLHASGERSLRGLLRLGEALFADIRGDEAAAIAVLDEIDGTDELVNVAADWMRSRMLSQTGHTGAAIAFADRAAAAGISGFHSVQLAPLYTRWMHGDIAGVRELVPRVTLRDDAPPREHFFYAISVGVFRVQLGEIDDAQALLRTARQLASSVEGSAASHWIALADVAVLLARGRESEAAAAFDALEIGEPRPEARRELRAFAALTARLSQRWYEVWRAPEFGPDVQADMMAVRALTAARAGRTGGDHPGANRLVTALGLRGAAELAVRLADDELARGLLELCGRRARTAIRACGEDSSMAAAAVTLLHNLPTPPESPTRVRLLGPSAIERADTTEVHPDWRRERVRSLLGLLVVRRVASRDSIAAAIWPDLDASAASQNLRRTLNYLHGVLEPDRGAGDAPWFVRSDGDLVRLVADGLWVDVWELEARLDAVARSDAAAQPAQVLDEVDAALALWRGDLLADIYDDWAAPPRENMRARFVAATVRAGELHLGRGQLNRALAIGLRALEAEPYSEAAHRLTMATHLARGDTAMAGRAYERCRAMLDELGAQPDAATTMLARAVFGA